MPWVSSGESAGTEVHTRSKKKLRRLKEIWPGIQRQNAKGPIPHVFSLQTCGGSSPTDSEGKDKQ